MKKSSDYVLLREIGKFVSVFDEDSIIVSYLMGYKIVNSEVGFPSKVLVKVINKLEDNNYNKYKMLIIVMKVIELIFFTYI